MIGGVWLGWSGGRSVNKPITPTAISRKTATPSMNTPLKALGDSPSFRMIKFAVSVGNAVRRVCDSRSVVSKPNRTSPATSRFTDIKSGRSVRVLSFATKSSAFWSAWRASMILGSRVAINRGIAELVSWASTRTGIRTSSYEWTNRFVNATASSAEYSQSLTTNYVAWLMPDARLRTSACAGERSRKRTQIACPPATTRPKMAKTRTFWMNLSTKRMTEVATKTPEFHPNKSSCGGGASCLSLSRSCWRRGWRTLPSGVSSDSSRFTRICLARSTTGFGTPARRATWMP
jgi:hypothetical protein